jgi:hypothetical protein
MWRIYRIFRTPQEWDGAAAELLQPYLFPHLHPFPGHDAAYFTRRKRVWGRC